MTGVEIDPGLVANLRELFGWHWRCTSAPAAAKAVAIEMYRQSIGGTKAAFQIAAEVSKVTGASIYDAKIFLYEAIWNRELIVDLFAPLLIVQPLTASRRDPLVVYSEWLRR